MRLTEDATMEGEHPGFSLAVDDDSAVNKAGLVRCPEVAVVVGELACSGCTAALCARTHR
jgi:hypothetical protein